MTFDSDIARLFAYQDARHEDAAYCTDMEQLPGLLGATLRESKRSKLVGEDIYVKRCLTYLDRRSDIAHEISHKISRERAEVPEGEEPPLTYEEAILSRHGFHIDNLDLHLERLMEAMQDRFLAPDEVVRQIIRINGLDARAVWLLHQFQEMLLHEALRRVVQYSETARIGGFIAENGIITHAYSYQWRLPVWVGDKMPNPKKEFQGDGVSLLRVPGRPKTHIGLVVVSE